jgi:hypothetical protein
MFSAPYQYVRVPLEIQADAVLPIRRKRLTLDVARATLGGCPIVGARALAPSAPVARGIERFQPTVRWNYHNCPAE